MEFTITMLSLSEIKQCLMQIDIEVIERSRFAVRAKCYLGYDTAFYCCYMICIQNIVNYVFILTENKNQERK